MKCYVLRFWQLALIAVATVGLVCMGIVGGEKLVASVSTSSRALPIYAVETENQEKLVAIGINCAWGDSDISAILATLKEKDVKATFFMVGSFVEKYPESVKAIYDAGHEIGNHSDTHADFATLSAEQIEVEVTSCNEKIKAITGESPTLVRPPSGSYNDTAIETIRGMGLDAIQWSLDSLDWRSTTLKEMENRILPNLTYGDILLFHNDTKYTATSLPTLIDEIKEKGYTFVTVGEMITPGHYNMDPTGRQIP